MKNIFEIITEIPIFVWPIFIFLLIGGIQATKKNEVSIFMLSLIPFILTIWSFLSFASRGKVSSLAILLWLLCLSVGCVVGYWQMKKVHLFFGKNKMTVELPGSWIPLILSMSIFSAKFFSEMLSTVQPHFIGSDLFLSLEFFLASLIGIFVGRGINCLIRYFHVLI